MKTKSNMRKSAGAVLGFVAATIFIIIAIGIFMYFAGRLVSGNQQLNSASDSGILAVARKALVQPAVALNDPNLISASTLPYSDFAYGGIADQTLSSPTSPTSPAIDIATYNRCAAQAVLVGLQSEIIAAGVTPSSIPVSSPATAAQTAAQNPATNPGVMAARAHAQALASAVLGIGKALVDKASSGSLDQTFNDNANANSLNMLGIGSTVTLVGSIVPTYVNAGKPSNIYFYPDVVNPASPSTALAGLPLANGSSDITPDQTAAKNADSSYPSGEKIYYVKGYTPIVVNASSATYSASLAFIPDNPQQLAHGIDSARSIAGVLNPAFINTSQTNVNAFLNNGVGSLTMPNGLFWVPPNSFQATTTGNVNISATKGSASSTGTGSGSSPSSPGSTLGSGTSGSTYVHAISCAIIGLGTLGNPIVKDYAAAIPGGFIRVCNMPDMVQANQLPLGPCPAAGANNTYDGSGFIANNQALGTGANGDNFLYVATPLPLNSDGTLNLNQTVFAVGSNGLLAMQRWTTFSNPKNFLLKSSSNYNADVVTINGVATHRDPTIDPFILGAPTPMPVPPPQLAAVQMNDSPPWQATYMLKGPNLNAKASLPDVLTYTGYVAVHSLNFDGTTRVTDSNGNSISSALIGQAMFDVAAPNLGTAGITALALSVDSSHAGWTQVEYLKWVIIKAFHDAYHTGHFEISNIPRSLLLTGLKYFNWYDSSGHLAHISSPNNYLHQTETITSTNNVNLGLEVPTSCQFMTIATPAQYLQLIDSVVQSGGGYQSGQIQLSQYETSIMQQLHLINPKWTVTDLQTALTTSTLATGTTMYLHDDGSGNLVMTASLPNNQPDSGIAPEGFQTLSNDTSSSVWFNTVPGQNLDLMGYTLNTSKDSGNTAAYTGDANVEQQPWRTTVGDIQLQIGSVLYKATGYNNLVGQVNFFSQPTQDINTISLSHSN